MKLTDALMATFLWLCLSISACGGNLKDDIGIEGVFVRQEPCAGTFFDERTISECKRKAFSTLSIAGQPRGGFLVSIRLVAPIQTRPTSEGGELSLETCALDAVAELRGNDLELVKEAGPEGIALSGFRIHREGKLLRFIIDQTKFPASDYCGVHASFDSDGFEIKPSTPETQQRGREL